MLLDLPHASAIYYFEDDVNTINKWDSDTKAQLTNKGYYRYFNCEDTLSQPNIHVFAEMVGVPNYVEPDFCLIWVIALGAEYATNGKDVILLDSNTGRILKNKY